MNEKRLEETNETDKDFQTEEFKNLEPMRKRIRAALTKPLPPEARDRIRTAIQRYFSEKK